MESLGAALFGIVIGWVTYRTLRRSAGNVGLSDIATVIGAVGGGVVAQRFEDPDAFGWYAVGLAIGFFGYLALAMILEGRKSTAWMGTQGDTPPNERWGRP
jgi:O-antigen/teichoic acid export membrane protein